MRSIPRSHKRSKHAASFWWQAFAAEEAAWQAARAPDPTLRAVMTTIAAEEATHAALAIAIDRWLEPRLSPTARREKRRLRREALGALRAELERRPDAPGLGLLTKEEHPAALEAWGLAIG